MTALQRAWLKFGVCIAGFLLWLIFFIIAPPIGTLILFLGAMGFIGYMVFEAIYDNEKEKDHYNDRS